ncbi:MAG: hypothetical protein IPQ01_09355 [Zoogloea sp.]|nr:hypothetical protein [Zoogloea sp.]
MGQNVSKSPLLKYAAAQNRPDGSLRFTAVADGKPRFYSYRVLAEYPLLVTVGVQDDAALADYRERRLGYMIFAGATSLMVLLFGAIAIRLLNGQFHIMQALRESQVRADSANRMKSEFLASMSHELRTPLNGIMGYAELLQESSSEENREFAGIVLESSQHLLELVDSILDLAKIESGKLELQRTPEPLVPLLEKIVRDHDPSAAQKGLTLTLDLAPDLPDTLLCDSTRVAQLLNNLLSNAIKFTDNGEIALCARRAGRMLEIAVSDSGCGIPDDMLPHIFERFRQVESFLTRRHQGTGLGLALVKDLVGLMGGDVRASSEVGKGSEFVVSLPLD